MAESPTRTMRATRGRYEPLGELGQGASATVWRALDRRTGRDVALKRFHPHLVADPVARHRIENEASAASRVSHPCIVSAIELIDDQDGLALVFPFVPGRTLAARLSDGSCVAPREAAAIALDIADALAVAHSRGVVHRDVKPGNILLGADGRARLLDFGISRAVDAGQVTHDLTGAGMTIGTLPYMAPEQLAAEPTTPASDVYALGVVLYEMLSGRRPFDAASPLTLAREQLQPPPAISGAPAPLVQLARAAMTADISSRPHAAQLARGLSAWRAGRSDADAATSVVAATPAQGSRPHQRARPLSSWAAIGLALVILAAATPLFAAALMSGAPASPQASPPAIALAPPTGSSPTGVPAPTQRPVVGASDTQSTNKPDGEGGHRGKHHHKKHHGKHGHHGKHHGHRHGH
jgi:eukaryotic-like serine/threonine-protein kinase